MRLLEWLDDRPVANKLTLALVVVGGLLMGNAFIAFTRSDMLNDAARETYANWLTAIRHLGDVRDALA